MVLSQGMLDLRSFGYGHRYIAEVKKKNQLDLCLQSFGLVSYYYGREAGLELREDVETVIEPGMVGSKFLLFCKPDDFRLQVVSMEPMVTVPQGRPGAEELVAQLDYHLYFNNHTIIYI